jgi:hypothetical protein
MARVAIIDVGVLVLPLKIVSQIHPFQTLIPPSLLKIVSQKNLLKNAVSNTSFKANLFLILKIVFQNFTLDIHLKIIFYSTIKFYLNPTTSS